MAPQRTPVLAATDGKILKLMQSDKGGITIYQAGADHLIWIEDSPMILEPMDLFSIFSNLFQFSPGRRVRDVHAWNSIQGVIMSNFVVTLFCILLFGSGVMKLELHKENEMELGNAKQILVVTTSGWDAVRGELQRFERRAANQPWQIVEGPIPIVVGRNGMAWGAGLNVDAADGGPIKKEGDGRAPAGVFSLGAAFGYEGREKIGRLGVPYLQATPTLECIDDTSSAHYNQVLDRSGVARPDWKSSEQMQRQDDQYRLGLIVNHNEARKPGGGSCIFLHIWAGEDTGTAGCTAMQSTHMESVLRWLDAKKKPVLVQLPVAEYRRFQKLWKLPG
jgi:D-alanyl-D-alanine dipeptidase